MDTNKTTTSSGMLEGAEYEKKLKQYYGDMLVYKSSANSKFFSALSLPSFMRDWLVMRFSNSEGVINKQEVSDYVKRVIPKKEQWNEYLVDLLHNDQTARFLAKVKIGFDAKTKTALFSLPDFEVPKKKGEAIVDWDVIEANREYLLSPTEVCKKYALYDHKICTGEEAAECVRCLAARVESTGYKIVVSRGDHITKEGLYHANQSHPNPRTDHKAI